MNQRSGGPSPTSNGEARDSGPVSIAPVTPLTPREGEVLFWITEGKRDGEIAAILGIGVRTINKHAQRIFQKLGVETRTAAARWALDCRSGPAGGGSQSPSRT